MNLVLKESLIRMRLGYAFEPIWLIWLVDYSRSFRMCCFVGPARTSKTIVYAGELSNEGIHVIAYQNTVGNGSKPQTPSHEWYHRGEPSIRQGIENPFLSRTETRVATANAMIIHFPAAEAMGPENMIDASDSPGFLEDIRRAIPDPMAMRGNQMLGVSRGMKSVQIFDKGSYTVVLASDASHIPDALDLLPADKRPPLNPGIFYAYSEWFPGWPIALCCFNNSDDVRVEPLLWWYKPRNPNILFVPTLDAHDGSAPDLNGQVLLDHTIAFGSDRLTKGFKVRYGGPIDPKVRKYLPSQIIGATYDGMPTQNGDFVCNINTLLSGEWYDSDKAVYRVSPHELVQLVS